jgi:hypothetical protein
MEETAVGDMVEKLGESVRIENGVKSKKYHWGGYVRIENGEDTVDKIDQQDGWIGKETTFRVELVDLKSGSKVGYMCPQSWLRTCQMIIGLHIGR